MSTALSKKNIKRENNMKIICLEKLLLKENGSEDMLNKVTNPKTSKEATIRSVSYTHLTLPTSHLV